MSSFDFAAARANLVENQVRCNGVTNNRLINAVAEVPREAFATPETHTIAYMDDHLRLKPGRFLLHARVFAKLAQAAEITPTDKILDVGCTTGYSSAVLSRLGAVVTALEEDEELAAAAKANLGPYNANVVTGLLKQGFFADAPYDVIFMNGSVPEKPETLCKQLAEGGRLVAVVGNAPVGRGYVFVRSRDEVTGRAVFDANVPSLPGFELAESFSF